MKKFILSALVFGSISLVSAQSIERQVIASTGGFNQVGTINISYTVGELAAVTTLSNSLMILTQGFQQPDATYTGIKTNTLENSVFSVFPNPASEKVTIRFSGFTDKKLKVVMFNVLGQIIRTMDYSQESGQIDYPLDLTGVSQGLYVIEVSGTHNGVEFSKQEKINVIF